MIGNVFEYLVSWSVLANSCKSMPGPHNFVSAFVDINVCPPPFFGKMFTKSTDKNKVGPPPPIAQINHLAEFCIHDVLIFLRYSVPLNHYPL